MFVYQNVVTYAWVEDLIVSVLLYDIVSFCLSQLNRETGGNTTEQHVQTGTETTDGQLEVVNDGMNIDAIGTTDDGAVTTDGPQDMDIAGQV